MSTNESSPDDRIGRLEKEVGELKESIPKTIEELREAVNSLKNTVVEIKSAVSELENPFNLLRVITSEEDIARLAEARRRLATSAQKAQKAVQETGQNKASRAVAVEKRKVEEVLEEEEPKAEEVLEKRKPVVEEVRREEGKPLEVKPPLPTAGFETGVSIIKWVWTLLDAGMDQEDVIDITKFCEFLGFLPPRSGEYVTYLINTMIKARAGGLNLDEFLLIIYSAARAAGIRIEMRELEETAFKLLRRILKKINYEGR